MPETEQPVVIPLKDGETVKVKVFRGTESASMELEAENGGCAVWTVTPLSRGDMVSIGTLHWLPDPALTAVQAERERIRTQLKASMVFGGVPSAVICRAIDAAIDAPAEVSEYERGQRDMRACCVALAERRAAGCPAGTVDYKAAYRAMALSMSDITIPTERPR